MPSINLIILPALFLQVLAKIKSPHRRRIQIKITNKGSRPEEDFGPIQWDTKGGKHKAEDGSPMPNLDGQLRTIGRSWIQSPEERQQLNPKRRMYRERAAKEAATTETTDKLVDNMVDKLHARVIPRSLISFPYSRKPVQGPVPHSRFLPCSTSSSKEFEPMIMENRQPKRNVWGEFAALGRSTPDIVNLGQGFPDYNPPDFVIEAAQNAMNKRELHQYARTPGHLELVELLAQRYSRHLGRTVDPVKEVAITIGASEGLFLSLWTILKQAKEESVMEDNADPPDEVVFFDPYFELYAGQLRELGAKAVVVPLRVKATGASSEWQIDWEVFHKAIGPKTAAIILNSPQNPTGKIFRDSELKQIADTLKEFPKVRVISDEVYKYILHPEDKTLKHVHFASLPGMWDRTLTVSSAGKTFGVTGWTLGWVIGPEQIMTAIHRTLPNLHFCAPMPLQQAMVEVLTQAEQPFDPLTMDHSSAPASHGSEAMPTYYSYLQQFYREKKEKLRKALAAAGLESLPADAGMFLLADITRLWPVVPEDYRTNPDHEGLAQDWVICRWLAQHRGILSLPASPFMQNCIKDSKTGESKLFARFCFAKTDETLDAACDRLERLVEDVRAAPTLPGPSSEEEQQTLKELQVTAERLEKQLAMPDAQPKVEPPIEPSVQDDRIRVPELFSMSYSNIGFIPVAVLIGSGIIFGLLNSYRAASNAGEELLVASTNGI